MGILSLISGEKKKFSNHATPEEINQARKGLVQGDIEVYETQKTSVGKMISNTKQKFRSTIAKGRMIKDERREAENIRLQKEYENLQLKNKVNKVKIQLERNKAPNALQRITGNLEALGGQRKIPTAARKNIPGSKKRIYKDQEGRNVFGGKDPFE